MVASAFCTPSKSYGGSSVKKMNSLFSLFLAKKDFFIKIFANLIVQLAITYYTFLKVPDNSVTAFQRTLLIIALFALVYGIVVSRPVWLKFILFCLFSFVEGILLSSLRNKIPVELIQNAFMGAAMVFVFMFVFALSLFGIGIYLNNKVGTYLFFALLLLIVLQFANMIAGTMLYKAISFFSLIIFSVYIIYDTHAILSRNYVGDFVTASFDYYLDILNIFLDISTLSNN